MDREWLADVVRFLGTLETAQNQLLQQLDQHRLALIAGDHAGLSRIAAGEEGTCAQLRHLSGTRLRLLEAAGLPQTATLKEALQNCPDAIAARIFPLIQDAEVRSRQLQHIAWTVWILGNRGQSYCQEMLELIAGGGQVAPVYEEHASHVPQTKGGMVLDACA